MGYAVCEDRDARDWGVVRWAGYGVPAICDWPECTEEIDRGLAYKCETHWVYDDEENESEEEGCGLYFCGEHQHREQSKHESMVPKPDTREWESWMLTDESWQQWRDENPEKLPAMRERVAALDTKPEEETPNV